jgi:hypothetical protein
LVETKPPEVPESAVFLPTFETTAGTATAGTAFAARLDGVDRAVIVTCRHLIGRRGGLTRDLGPGEWPAALKRVELTDRFSGKKVGAVTRVLPLPASAGDVAAFAVGEGQTVAPFRFAAEAPGEKAVVWLIARLPDSPRKAHRARVVSAGDGVLQYRFDTAPDLGPANGAPLLNADGEVVGVHIGSDDMDGHRHGVALRADGFLSLLKEAATR